MKKLLIIIVILLLVLLTISIMDTYGLFETNANSNTNFEVGRWVILLNNTDVNTENSITLNSFVYESKNHIENGYIAPGSSATLDLVIDATNASTAFSYQISLDDSMLDDFPNLTLVTKNKDTNEVIDLSNFSGNIYMNDNRIFNIELSLVWEDNILYDETDINVLDNDISFPLSMHFSQLIEE